MRKARYTITLPRTCGATITVPTLWRIWWFFGYHGLYQLNWWWKERKIKNEIRNDSDRH